MFKHLETATETEMREFTKAFCSEMGWPDLRISRFRYSNLRRFRGYALINVTEKRELRFVFVSNNPQVYAADFISDYAAMCALVHELIHIYIWETTGNISKAFNHGKTFKKVCEQVQKKSRGFYTVRNLID